jgi:hypothetical protein
LNQSISENGSDCIERNQKPHLGPSLANFSQECCTNLIKSIKSGQLVYKSIQGISNSFANWEEKEKSDGCHNIKLYQVPPINHTYQDKKNDDWALLLRLFHLTIHLKKKKRGKASGPFNFCQKPHSLIIFFTFQKFSKPSFLKPQAIKILDPLHIKFGGG